jgi:hypothetical protein
LVDLWREIRADAKRDSSQKTAAAFNKGAGANSDKAFLTLKSVAAATTAVQVRLIDPVTLYLSSYLYICAYILARLNSEHAFHGMLLDDTALRCVRVVARCCTQSPAIVRRSWWMWRPTRFWTCKYYEQDGHASCTTAFCLSLQPFCFLCFLCSWFLDAYCCF